MNLKSLTAALLERRVRLDALARGEGADVMCPFVNSALSLRRTLRENRP